MGVAIVTDTNSGINEELATELGVFLIPMPVIIDGNIRFEGVDLTEEELYSALRNGQDISTSQPSPGDVMEKWDEVLSSYDEIVYIPMSSGLSGSCLSAQGLATEYEDKVFVVDNHRISVTMKASVLQALNLAKEGKTASEIKDILENVSYDATIYLAVDSLEFLKKGGRVSPAVATIGTLLSIKPILTIQGEKIEPWSKVRGNIRKCEMRMLEAVKKDWSERFSQFREENLMVGVAGAGLSEEQKNEWLNMAKEEFPKAKVYYDPLSASIGTHTGPGAVGIGVSFVK